MEIKARRCPTCVGTVLFLTKTHCDICGSELVEQEEELSPQEINFITHPFLKTLVERMEKEPDLIYAITKDDEPIAIVMSPVLHERMREDIQMMCDRLNEART